MASAVKLPGKSSSSDGTPSTASFSKTLSSADAFLDIVPEELSFEKLEESLTLLQKANLILCLENEILEEKLRRESPDLIAGITTALETKKSPTTVQFRGKHSGSGSGSEATAEAPSSSSLEDAVEESLAATATRSTRSRVVLTSPNDTVSNPRLAAPRARAERVPRMSFSQRMDIAEEAARLAAQRARTLRTQTDDVAADLRARHEVANAQLADTRATRHNLETLMGPSRTTGPALSSGTATPAKKLSRFITECIKASEANVERLRFKICTLRAHHKRIRANIAVKRELGDALHPVDFDKVRIEIEEYNRKIKSKNQHLNDLKNISGSATSRLLASKRRLSEFSKQLDTIRRKTASKRNQIAALEQEEQKVLEDVGRADMALSSIRSRVERYSAPDVLVYVSLKRDLDTLRRGVVAWERRCRMQQQTARDLRRGVRSARSAHAQENAPARINLDHTASESGTSSSERGPSTSTAKRHRPHRPRSRSRSRSPPSHASESCPSTSRSS